MEYIDEEWNDRKSILYEKLFEGYITETEYQQQIHDLEQEAEEYYTWDDY